MNTKGFRHFQGFRRRINVFIHRAGQGADATVFDMTGNGLHRLEITGGRNRKAHFHYIHAQAFQRQSDLQFFFHRQTGF